MKLRYDGIKGNVHGDKKLKTPAPNAIQILTSTICSPTSPILLLVGNYHVYVFFTNGSLFFTLDFRSREKQHQVLLFSSIHSKS